MALKIHRVADELIDSLAGIVKEVQQHDSDLARQLRRAAQSVPLNIAEGEKLGRNGNQRIHFERAAGSLGETRSALRVAASWGYVDRGAVERSDAIADGLAAMLWRLTHPR